VTAIGDSASGWLASLVVAGLLWPLSPPGRRADAAAVVALLLLYLVVLAVAVALLDPVLQPWSPAIAAAAVWLALQPLLGLGKLSSAALGLVPPRPGSLGPAVWVTLLALAVNAAVILLRGAASIGVTFPLALAVLVAAVFEELVMRGALLAFADRACAPRWTLAGASIGPGGLVVTAAFILLHGLRPGLLLGVAPAALLYLWLRARTGSLAPPIAAHVLWNTSVLALHA
jgi:membrane protease YdiL (CAAX protease family)